MTAPTRPSLPPELREPTIDEVMYRLEDAMHQHCDQPLKVDAMSLTRHWRGILSDYRAAIDAALLDLVQDAERYRFLRDNPLQLRAIDGNAGWCGQIAPSGIDRLTDAARATTPEETPAHER